MCPSISRVFPEFWGDSGTHRRRTVSSATASAARPPPSGVARASAPPRPVGGRRPAGPTVKNVVAPRAVYDLDRPDTPAAEVDDLLFPMVVWAPDGKAVYLSEIDPTADGEPTDE